MGGLFLWLSLHHPTFPINKSNLLKLTKKKNLGDLKICSFVLGGSHPAGLSLKICPGILALFISENLPFISFFYEKIVWKTSVEKGAEPVEMEPSCHCLLSRCLVNLYLTEPGTHSFYFWWCDFLTEQENQIDNFVFSAKLCLCLQWRYYFWSWDEIERRKYFRANKV